MAVYRQAILKDAFEGRFTAKWRDSNADHLESAEQMLSRVRAIRRSKFSGRGKYTEPLEIDPNGLPEIPHKWPWARLDLVGVVGSGMSVSKDRQFSDPLEVSYLRVANVQRGRLDLSEIKTMKIERAALDELRLQKGDILFNEGGDRDKLGRGWIWEGQIDPCITQNHVFRVTPIDTEIIDPLFVSHWGNSFGQQFFLRNGKQTTNLASINKSVLSSLPVPIPSIIEQRQIISYVEELNSSIGHLESDIETNLQKAETLRQSILKKAFAGELVPQDPSDEPASLLLERIRAERDAKPNQVSKKSSPKKPNAKGRKPRAATI